MQGNKLKQSNRLARKYLSEAKKALNDKTQFYIALERALHNYLKAKLKIETSELSKDKTQELLTDKNVQTSDIEGFIQLLENCEMARYSPMDFAKMNNDYQQAIQVISKMDKQL